MTVEVNGNQNLLSDGEMKILAKQVTESYIASISPKIPATEFLKEAADQMAARAALRDNPEGERTAKKIAEVFNALTGHKLTEVDAWTFLLIMKMVRGRSGKFHKDDGVDGCAYFALMAEADSTNPERK